MSKLNTTVDNIELKSNRVTGSTPSASWTDAQYPSAKALYNTYSSLYENFNSVNARCAALEAANISLTATSNNMLNVAHPVGSIMITATNSNPANTIGGSWTLVDKGFADISGYITSEHFTAGSASLADGNSSLFLLKDHMFTARLNLVTTAALSDTTATLGTLNLSNLGISVLPYTVVSDVTASDGGQCTILYSINNSTGAITTTDVFSLDDKHSLAAGSTFSIHISQPISYTEMLDAYCNKFYWKRTA